MFNIIIEKCPEVVECSGHSLDIETDFKVILKLLTMLNESTDENGNAEIALDMFFKEKIPSDVELAIEIFESFISYDPNDNDQEDEEEIDEYEEGEEDEENYFDIIFDSNYIYCAFLQVYHIDLSNINIHWWKFKALIRGLPSTTKLSDIVQIRAQELPKDSKSRIAVAKLKEAYKLPHKDKFDEKQAESAIDALFAWAKS